MRDVERGHTALARHLHGTTILDTYFDVIQMLTFENSLILLI